MKHRGKQIWSILLSLALALPLVPAFSVTALADGETSYTIIIPSTLTVSGVGWNAIGNISVTGSLAEGKKLKVAATSANDWNLKKDSENMVPYTLKNDAAGDEATSWEFTALSSTAATKPIGIDVSDYSGMSPGAYTDTVTFTASVADTTVNLATLTDGYVAQDGDVLKGTLSGNYRISIADGATVTLDGVTINGIDNSAYKWAGITCEGTATIILKEGTMNRVKGFDRSYPAIFVPENHTLTIAGTGELETTARNGGYGDCCAGIGGGNHLNCGNITIRGGIVTATGGEFGAGIGGGYEAKCGNITIKGGTVIATGGYNGAGIGSGCDPSSICGNITIESGTVTAIGGQQAAGIGTGYNSYCGKITIKGDAVVTATGSDADPKQFAAGIGCGTGGICGDIIISGGRVNAKGSRDAAAIGSTDENCGDIIISGGNVIAKASKFGAGIGSGHWGGCGNISISGGTVTATGGNCGSGIGSGGGSSGMPASCGHITISGGTVTATGGRDSAGIGTGSIGKCLKITIEGGNVTANGGKNDPGIGLGDYGECLEITITSDVAQITATRGKDAVGEYIGRGNGDSCGTVTIDNVVGANKDSTFTHFNSVVNGDTWTLTHK